MKSSNWLLWGVAAVIVYSIAKSAQANPLGPYGPPLPQDFTPVPWSGPINQPGYIPAPGQPGFVGPVLNQPAATGGAAGTNPGLPPVLPGMDIQTALWDPCNTGSLVYDPSACTQSGRTPYDGSITPY